MSVERTPVLVGVGQVTDKHPDLAARMGPLALLRAAAERAADDAGLGRTRLGELDLVTCVKMFRDDLKNPPDALASTLGADRARRLYGTTGGNTPQLLVNRTAEAIARGEVNFALIAGAEAIDTATRAREAGIDLGWSDPSTRPPELVGVEERGTTKQEHYHGLSIPAFSYPLFENALRGRYGWTLAQHRAALGALFSRFTEVAAGHAHAWFPVARTPEDIATVSANNRMIALPYTKTMNAMNTVNQSAAVLMTSIAGARRLGVDASRWVYLHGCADAVDHFYLLDRVNYWSSPAIARAGREALRMAGVGIETVRWFDLYSCFPSAVQIARDALGIAANDPRPLTLTGGLPFFGGAGNDYTLHAIVTLAERLRAKPGDLGLVTGNGWYLTKHSIGIYGTAPSPNVKAGAAWTRVDPSAYQRDIDAEPHPGVAVQPDGKARVETYTVVYERDGRPVRGIVIGRLADDRRFVALTPEDRPLLERIAAEEFLGATGTARPGERTNLFVPD